MVKMDIPESFKDIHLSSQLASLSMDIPRNIPRFAKTIKALANGGIFLGISVEMVLAGLRDRYPWNSQECLYFKPASTISTDIPGNIPGDIPPLVRAFSIFGQILPDKLICN